VLGPNGKTPCDRLQELVGEIASYDPDVVFAASYPQDAIAVVQTMKDRKYTPPALLAFGAGFLNESFISGVKKPNSTQCPGLPVANPDGIVARASWSRSIALGNRGARPIVKAYEKRFGKLMNSRSAAGFTAMLTVVQAIRDAGMPSPPAIRDALQRLNLPAAGTIMPWDGVDFDANGQNAKARVVLQQIIGGSWVDVDPDNVIWPLAQARARK
jgi:branched-chain amino acid transport system substrate-binding protein